MNELTAKELSGCANVTILTPQALTKQLFLNNFMRDKLGFDAKIS
jgi:hypothetical protein